MNLINRTLLEPRIDRGITKGNAPGPKIYEALQGAEIAGEQRFDSLARIGGREANSFGMRLGICLKPKLHCPLKQWVSEKEEWESDVRHVINHML